MQFMYPQWKIFNLLIFLQEWFLCAKYIKNIIYSYLFKNYCPIIFFIEAIWPSEYYYSMIFLLEPRKYVKGPLIEIGIVTIWNIKIQTMVKKKKLIDKSLFTREYIICIKRTNMLKCKTQTEVRINIYIS